MVETSGRTVRRTIDTANERLLQYRCLQQVQVATRAPRAARRPGGMSGHAAETWWSGLRPLFRIRLRVHPASTAAYAGYPSSPQSPPTDSVTRRRARMNRYEK